MKAHGPVLCRPNQIGTKQQEVWIKRGGPGSSGSGPSGWKLRPSAVRARAAAEKARAYRTRKPTKKS